MVDETKAVAVIEVELDDKKFNEDIDKLKKATGAASETIQDNLNFEPKISFTKVLNSLANFLSTIATIGSGLLVLQKRFGLFTRVFEKMGIDIDNLISKGEDLFQTFIDFIKGAADFGDIKFGFIELLIETGLLDSKIALLVKSFNLFQTATSLAANNLTGIASAAAVSWAAFQTFDDIIKVTAKSSKILFGSKGLFGLTSAFGLVGGAAELVSQQLDEFDNGLAKVASGTAKVVAVVAGGLSVALSFAILKVAEYGQKISSNIIDKNREMSKSFLKISKNILIFTKVVENFNRLTNGSSGNVASWNKEIQKLSETFNFNKRTLQKSAQEIIAVTSQIGLNEKQMKKLLKVSIEFAKINGKDVFQTTLAVVSGLNGSSQALQAYGIKLNQTAVLQNAFKDGLTKNFNALSENEKVQLRYNKLLKTYKGIQGVAEEAANSFGDQVERLSVRYTTLNESFSRGVNLVEELGVVAFGFNKVLSLLNNEVVSVSGFIFALGARIINVGSILLGFSFKIFGLIKAIKLLDVLLRTQTGITLFAQNLPVINRSLNSLASSVGGVKVEIKSLATLMKASRAVIVASLNSISLAFFGLNLSALSFFGAIKGGTAKLIAVVKKLTKFLWVLIAPFKILLGWIALLVSGFLVVKNIIDELSEKTTIFTKTFALFGKKSGRGIASINAITEAFKDMAKWVGDKLSKAFGIMIAAILASYRILLFLAAKNPFNVFSRETVEGFKQISKEIDIYGMKLLKAGFDTRKVTSNMSRDIASVGDAVKELNIADLAALENEFKNFGKSQLTILKEQLNSRQELINLAVVKGVRTQEAANILLLQIQQDFEAKRALIGKEARDKLLQDMMTFTERFKNVGKTELQILADKMAEDLSTLQGFRDKDVISLQKYLSVKKSILDKFDIDRAASIEKGTKKEKDSLELLNENLNSLLKGAAVSVVKNAMADIGAQLAGGGFSFEKFAGTILSIIGTLLLQLSSSFIAIGLGVEAIKVSIATLAAGPALAAGLALAATGGALKAFGASLGGSSSSPSTAATLSSSGGGVASSGSSSGDFGGLATAQNEVESGPSTAVNLTINGDVIDGDSSGLRIVELLNDAFETKGAVLSSDARFA